MLQCLEFVCVAEQDVRTYEEVYEMSVGVPDELLHRVVGKHVHMVEHVLKDISQCHVAESVAVYDCKAGVHPVLFCSGSALLLEYLQIFIETVGVVTFNYLIVENRSLLRV